MIRKDGRVHPSPIGNATVPSPEFLESGTHNVAAPPLQKKVRLPSPAAAVGNAEGTHGSSNPKRGSYSIQEACKGTVENMGEAKLCLPTVRGTLLSSFLVSGLIFIGLVSLSISEVGAFGQRWDWLILLLRFIGWLFLFYIPIHFVAMPFTRNFVLWSLRPGEKLSNLSRAHVYTKHRSLLQCRARLLPYVIHTAWIGAYAFLICVDLGEDKEHFGFIFIYGLGNLLVLPIGVMSSLLLAPPTISRSYAFKIGPCTLLLPIMGFLLLVTSYTLLRRSCGPQLGFLIPFVPFLHLDPMHFFDWKPFILSTSFLTFLNDVRGSLDSQGTKWVWTPRDCHHLQSLHAGICQETGGEGGLCGDESRPRGLYGHLQSTCHGWRRGIERIAMK